MAIDRWLPLRDSAQRARARRCCRTMRRDALRDDLVAALIISVLLIPQGLAYALLAGLPPQVGSVCEPAAAGGVRSARLEPGARGRAGRRDRADDRPGDRQVRRRTSAPHAAALVLAAEVGVLLAIAAWLRLDALAALLSVPVLRGFETGATLSITLSQLPVLLGSSARGSSLPDVLALLVALRAGHGCR